jgi:hypothetical protein
VENKLNGSERVSYGIDGPLAGVTGENRFF